MKSDCNCVIKNPDIFTKNFLNNLPIPIVVITMDKKIYYVNAAFENITGYYKEEVFEKLPPYPWWPKNESQKCYGLFDKCFNGRKKYVKK